MELLFMMTVLSQTPIFSKLFKQPLRNFCFWRQHEISR